MSGISVLVPTRNHIETLPGCLETVIEWCDDIHVLDSFSTDGTVAFAHLIGAKITSRRFDDWLTHRDWALHNINFKYEWVLCLNADERVSSALSLEIIHAAHSAGDIVAFEIQRRATHDVECNHDMRLIKPRHVLHRTSFDSDVEINGPTGNLKECLDPNCFDGSKHWFEPRSWFERDAHFSHCSKN
jgi:glycosyltransferase involved in cell wall biosynthesis